MVITNFMSLRIYLCMFVRACNWKKAKKTAMVSLQTFTTNLLCLNFNQLSKTKSIKSIITFILKFLKLTMLKGNLITNIYLSNNYYTLGNRSGVDCKKNKKTQKQKQKNKT